MDLPYKLLFCLQIQRWFSQLPTLPWHPETWKSIFHLCASKNLSSDTIFTAQTFPGICAVLEAQDRPAHSSTTALDVDTPTDSATGDRRSPPKIWHSFHNEATIFTWLFFYILNQNHLFTGNRKSISQVFGHCKVLLNSTKIHQLAHAEKSSHEPREQSPWSNI